MRLIGLALLVFSVACFGQGYHAGLFNPTPRVTGGFGNVVFPGGTPATTPGLQRSFGNVVFPGGGGPRLNVPLSAPVLPSYGSYGVANLGPSVGFGRTGRNGGGYRTGYTGTYAVPIYVGGYGAYGYAGSYGSYLDNPYPTDAGAPAPQQPNVIVIYPQGAGAPPVAYAAGPPAAYAGEPSQLGGAQPFADANSNEPPHYLIAFKDHTIYSAVAYWVDGDTLHYFTSGSTHNQVSLSLVDKDLTERLNREAGTDLQLPR